MLDEILASLAQAGIDLTVLVAALAAVIGGGAFWFARSRRVATLKRWLAGDPERPGAFDRALDTLRDTFDLETVSAGAVPALEVVAYHVLLLPTWTSELLEHGPDLLPGGSLSDALSGLVARGDQADQLARSATGLEALADLEASTAGAEQIDAAEAVGIALATELDAAPEGPADLDPTAATEAGELSAEAFDGVGATVPVLTVLFAGGRAFGRMREGVAARRIAEFFTTEVGTRGLGGWAGAKGGALAGLAVGQVPGMLIGALVGGVLGHSVGVSLGEHAKQHHLRRARHNMEVALAQLGERYAKDDGRFNRVLEALLAEEQRLTDNLEASRAALRRYRNPLRRLWPNAKIVLLKEAVRIADDRLDRFRDGVLTVRDRLVHLRAGGHVHGLGTVVWTNRALRDLAALPPEDFVDVEASVATVAAEARALGLSLRPAQADDDASALVSASR